MRFEVVFIGTGCSGACPSIQHLLQPPRSIREVPMPDGARVQDLVSSLSPGNCLCKEIGNGLGHPDRRNNVSLMIRVWLSGRWYHTLIDCGKTFRDAVLNVFHPLGLAHVDEVLLTHGHKDACGGLDDLRDLQNFSMTPEREYRVSGPLTVVSDHTTVIEVQRQFSYMFDTSKRPTPAADGSYSMKAKMAVLDLVSLNRGPEDAGDIQSRVIPGGMEVTVLPVWHGKGYYCLGFAFERVLYLSDVSEVPSHIGEWISSHGPWKLIVIDSLRVHAPHFSHMSLSEALKLILKWDPEEARIVGMGCEMNSRETDPQLAMVVAAAKGRLRRVTLGRDGEVVKFEC